jgi:hypothetical protein
MAVFFWALAILPSAQSPAHAEDGPLSLAIETVSPGREGLEFSAHLTGTTHPVTRGITWTIRTADGQDVYAGDSAIADVVTPPGDYIVDVRYGAGRLTRLVSLPEATRLRVDFALNAGGLRIVPRAGGAPLPAGGAKLRVYTLQEGQPNRRMAVTATAGDILPLPEGRYRVESQVGDSNAKAVADVEVRAGRLITLDIRHKVGIARLSLAGPPSAEVSWSVEDRHGIAVASRDGQDTAVILIPGDYTVTAKIGSDRLTAAFTIAPGQSRDIILGN